MPNQGAPSIFGRGGRGNHLTAEYDYGWRGGGGGCCPFSANSILGGGGGGVSQ